MCFSPASSTSAAPAGTSAASAARTVSNARALGFCYEFDDHDGALGAPVDVSGMAESSECGAESDQGSSSVWSRASSTLLVAKSLAPSSSADSEEVRPDASAVVTVASSVMTLAASKQADGELHVPTPVKLVASVATGSHQPAKEVSLSAPLAATVFYSVEVAGAEASSGSVLDLESYNGVEMEAKVVEHAPAGVEPSAFGRNAHDSSAAPDGEPATIIDAEGTEADGAASLAVDAPDERISDAHSKGGAVAAARVPTSGGALSSSLEFSGQSRPLTAAAAQESNSMTQLTKYLAEHGKRDGGREGGSFTLSKSLCLPGGHAVIKDSGTGGAIGPLRTAFSPAPNAAVPTVTSAAAAKPPTSPLSSPRPPQAVDGHPLERYTSGKSSWHTSMLDGASSMWSLSQHPWPAAAAAAPSRVSVSGIAPPGAAVAAATAVSETASRRPSGSFIKSMMPGMESPAHVTFENFEPGHEDAVLVGVVLPAQPPVQSSPESVGPAPRVQSMPCSPQGTDVSGEPEALAALQALHGVCGTAGPAAAHGAAASKPAAPGDEDVAAEPRAPADEGTAVETEQESASGAQTALSSLSSVQSVVPPQAELHGAGAKQVQQQHVSARPEIEATVLSRPEACAGAGPPGGASALQVPAPGREVEVRSRAGVPKAGQDLGDSAHAAHSPQVRLLFRWRCCEQAFTAAAWFTA
jgi:hypothetical protein